MNRRHPGPRPGALDPFEHNRIANRRRRFRRVALSQPALIAPYFIELLYRSLAREYDHSTQESR